MRNTAVHTARDAAQGNCGTTGRATTMTRALHIEDADADGVAESSISWATTYRDPRQPWQVGVDVFEGSDTYTLTGGGFLSEGEADAYRAEHPDWPGPGFTAAPGSWSWPGGSAQAALVRATETFGGCQRGVVAPCGNADAGRP